MNSKKKRFCSLDFLSVTDNPNSEKMLNGSADVSMSAVSHDSASSSFNAFDSIYDIFGDTFEDDPSSNTSIENIFQKIVRFLIHYESESMHSIACESCLTRDMHF